MIFKNPLKGEKSIRRQQVGQLKAYAYNFEKCCDTNLLGVFFSGRFYISTTYFDRV